MFAASLLVAAILGAPSFRVYVSNEKSDDITVIDGDTLEAVARIPVGKRPRGIKGSPDGKLLYVAISGTPIGGALQKETLHAGDRGQDGIAVVDLAAGKAVRRIKAGSSPWGIAVVRR